VATDPTHQYRIDPVPRRLTSRELELIKEIDRVVGEIPYPNTSVRDLFDALEARCAWLGVFHPERSIDADTAIGGDAELAAMENALDAACEAAADAEDQVRRAQRDYAEYLQQRTHEG
jgi:hypothetical protein